MLELDECNQLLVTNSFTNDGFGGSSSNNDTLTSSSSYHPLRTTRSESSIPSDACIVGSESGTRPGSTHLLNLNGPSALETSNGAPSELHQDNDIIVHPVGPNDSFAGVALRYGVSIAALRRANQLWPSDPIHLRTELLVPRRGVFFSNCKSLRHASTVAPLVPDIRSAASSSSDLVASPFAAARNMILSVFQARLSLESLSSRASASEDHELDDFRARPAAEPPFAVEGHELSTLTSLHTPHKRVTVPLLPQNPPPPTNYQHPDIPPVNDLRFRSGSSPRTASFQRLPHIQPFAVGPVRTSQLEPEPAMELPVRRPAFNDRHLQTDGTRRKQLRLNRPGDLYYR